MASIHKKGNKYYIVAKINGKQKWIAGKRTKEETKKYMREILYKIENDKVRVDTVNMTVKEFLDNWYNTYCINNLKLTTYTGYRQYLDSYIIPRIGNVRIVDLKPIEIQNMYYDIMQNGRVNGNKPLSGKTIVQAHRILHKALKSAVMMQILEMNPCDFVELPKKKKFKPSVLDEEEVKPFINGFKNTEVYIGVVLAITLGLRRGEVLGLLWKDIDFKKKILTVDKTLVVADKKIKVDTPKTEKSNRVLLLSNSLIEVLILEKENRQALDNDYVVLNPEGERWNPSSFSRRYSEIRDKKCLKKIRFHDLRHTNATIMYRANIKAKVMQERLGHSNISTTLDIYTHLFKEDQQEVADIFDNKIFKN
ncbi:tyrosine-type recombinase/integrase [Sporosalibacterium faouarense]|uniref:tyrosine-type recombinase/integrase n=1 Tax=Sporosalibacterium faouarense TaxID=516123 RepID=UPI00192B127F|nr:site-specific integrase [Sporosalibacterium faouarense]